MSKTKELERRIRYWRGQRLRAMFLEGTLRFCALAGGYFLFILVLDYAFSLAQSVRWGLFGIGSLVGVGGLSQYLLFPLSALRSDRLLKDVGAKYPEVLTVTLLLWVMIRTRPDR